MEKGIFQKNMGILDRSLRLVVGVGIVSAGIYYQSWLGLIGILPLTVGVSGSCPAYVPFKFNTFCSRGKKAIEGSEG